MTVFGRTDMQSIQIPVEAGGCGRAHKRRMLNAGAYFEDQERSEKRQKGVVPEFAEGPLEVDCELCEPILLTQHGFARIAEKRELTPDEVQEAERLKAEGTVATQVMAARLGSKLAEMVAAEQTSTAAAS